MPELFLLRALAAGIGIAWVAGITGCFVVWRRMAYFGDSLAHSALLGIALGIATGISPHAGSVIVCTVFAFILLWLQQKKVLATDTLLGILAHAALSVGMVTISLLDQPINLHAYLFGDILTTTSEELWWIYTGGGTVLLLLLLNWSSLVLMTLHEDLARAEGVHVLLMHLLLMLLMTTLVAISIRIVGILLITSMLIIPAATARQLARSPEIMAAGAAILGMIAVLLGIYGSVQLDTPSGPSIVVAAVVLFAVCSPVFAWSVRRKQI